MLSEEEAECMELIVEKRCRRGREGWIWQICIPQASWGIVAEGGGRDRDEVMSVAKAAMEVLYKKYGKAH